MLDHHRSSIVKYINLLALIPYLIASGLLTQHEKELLQNRNLTEYERKLELLTVVEKKGSEGCWKFLKAVSEEPEHSGHREIVRIFTDPGKEALIPATGKINSFHITISISILISMFKISNRLYY